MHRMSGAIALVALAVLVAVPACMRAVEQDESTSGTGDTFELGPGPNRDLVAATCTPCHSAAIILQHRMTRAEWDETITWMQKTQNLWALEPDMRSSILDYLEAAQGRGDGAGAEGQFEYPANPVW